MLFYYYIAGLRLKAKYFGQAVIHKHRSLWEVGRLGAVSTANREGSEWVVLAEETATTDCGHSTASTMVTIIITAWLQEQKKDNFVFIFDLE